MEEQKKIERELMGQEEFDQYLSEHLKRLRLQDYNVVGKFKSAGRAVKRGHILSDGTRVPSKPFNSRGNSSKRKGKHSRSMNEEKKKIYESIIEYRKRASSSN